MDWQQIPYTADKLHPTILTTCKPNHYHPSGLRRFSTREAAALQTFPHHFEFKGPNQATKWKQIGNAVPPLFAGSLFRHLIRELSNNDEAELKGALI
jgi:DNA (cytosine-5)-methyltransferase 1